MDPKRKKHHWSSNKHSAKIYFGLPSICFEVIVILLQFRVRVHTFTMQTRFQTILNNSFFSSHVWRKRFMHYLEKIFLQIYLYERGPKKLREFEKEGKQPLQLHSTYFSIILLAPLSKYKICTFTTSLNQKVLLHLYNT